MLGRSHTSIADDKNLQNKTKRILLEYFSLIPEEKPINFGINNEVKRAEIPHDAENGELAGTQDVERMDRKYHTEVINQEELDVLRRQLAAHAKDEDGKVYLRSKSFESRKYHLRMRKKMQELLCPISSNNLSYTEEKDGLIHQHCENRLNTIVHFCKCKKKKCLKITIPEHTMKNEDNIDVESADTYAVNLLEEISQDIMAKFPNVFDGAIQEFLTPLQDKKEIPYESFSTVIKLFIHQVKGTITNIWHKTSLVMALIKEIMIVGNFDEDMMEIMVDHSTKFFMENIMVSVVEEGGWEILDITDYQDELGLGCLCLTDTDVYKTSRYETMYRWLPIVVAVLTVGIGVAFSRHRTGI